MSLKIFCTGTLVRPSTPNSSFSIKELVAKVCEEARVYTDAGVDGIIVENMHDIPYVMHGQVGPEIVSSMTRICCEVKNILPSNLPCGIQILAGANEQALAVAQASELDFIRAECYVYSHVADEGLMNGCAGKLLRYRRQIGAQNVLIFTDIKKKHSSHSITNDISITEMAKGAEFFSADGVIVTGTSTGTPAEVTELTCVKEATNIPVLVGSGVTLENWNKYSEIADAVIIGSYFKDKNDWRNSLCSEKIKKFMRKARET